jgi:hypothetical protein
MLFIAGLSVAGADARDRVGGVVTGRGDPQERALAVAQSGGGGASERSLGACGTLLGFPLPGSLSTGDLALEPAHRQEPSEQNRDGYHTAFENRISRPRRKVHNLKGSCLVWK